MSEEGSITLGGAPEGEVTETNETSLADAAAMLEGIEPGVVEAAPAVMPNAPPETSQRSARAIADAMKKQHEARKATKEAEAIKSKYSEYEGLAAKVKAGEIDPDEFLAKLGLPYRDLTDAMMKHAKAPPDKAETALSRVEELERKLAEKEQALAQAEESRVKEGYQQQLTARANDFVAQNAEKYDAIKAYGYEGKLVEMQVKHYEATADENGEGGEVLTLEQAADSLEALLVEQQVNKALKTKYARALSQESSGKPPQGLSGNTRGKTTLSNNLSGTVTAASAEPEPLTLAQIRKQLLSEWG